MKVNYKRAKSLLYKIIFSFDLLINFIIILYTETNSNNIKEYTGASHLILNIYTIIIFILMTVHSFFPIFKPKIIKTYFNFILIDKGKIIITFLISMIYRFSPSIPYFLLGIILFISSFILFIYEYILKYESIIELLKLKDIELYNIGNDIDNYKDFTLKTIDTMTELNSNNNNNSSNNISNNSNNSSNSSTRLKITKQK